MPVHLAPPVVLVTPVAVVVAVVVAEVHHFVILGVFILVILDPLGMLGHIQAQQMVAEAVVVFFLTLQGLLVQVVHQGLQAQLAVQVRLGILLLMQEQGLRGQMVLLDQLVHRVL